MVHPRHLETLARQHRTHSYLPEMVTGLEGKPTLEIAMPLLVSLRVSSQHPSLPFLLASLFYEHVEVNDVINSQHHLKLNQILY